ncbi:hypothetical protein HYV21_01170 [Candidatus Microgenomates bacterium]|nr:hypothetical protein [Candidatus Microgenomates bacterium]
MVAKKRATSARSRWEMYSQVLISGAILAVFLAAVGYLGADIWLASTQWLLVAAVLAALGVYAKLEK